MSAATVRPLRAVPKADRTPAQAVNALWFRLDQARAVALCIPDKCDGEWELEAAIASLAQVGALAGAVAEMLALALADLTALECQV